MPRQDDGVVDTQDFAGNLLTMSSFAVKHLRDARNCLLQEQRDLPARIIDIDRAILGLIMDSDSPSTMREVIEQFVHLLGPIRSDEIASALSNQFGWNEASVRSLLTKMAKEGQIARESWGVYR